MFKRLIIAFLLLAVLPSMAMAQEAEPAPLPVVKHIKKAKAKKPVAAEEPAPADDSAPEYNTVILQGLNKVTGHISKLDGPLGTVLRFGNLEIIAHRCWKSSPEERPENAALLEIRELTPGEGPQKIFLGWMFSSSPGLSGLEHPVYDINVLSCEIHTDSAKPDAIPAAKDTAADLLPEKKDSKK